MSRRQRGAGEVMKEETIFHLALDKPPAERAAFLEETCAGDAALCRRVQVLLQEHENPRSLLEPPAAGLESNLTLDAPTAPLPPGTVIGRYKLLEPIGEGGYGAVFMAEQTSPVRRKVALKIIKAGMDTRQVIARFEAERQALALMDHPNIAKVFDAGVTDGGRPYFVMELVKGTPVTRYCDEHRLTPRQRLELFVQVCHAVQHAHQKGIIHRDLKPSNVLVAPYDGKPVPKVIDFGVAKATGQQLTDRTMFTGFGDVIGTPQYMSPEQAELNQLDIDTRSDVYSLGVLLYELLTGTTPIEHNRVRDAALLEVLRFIREEEPPKPSTRLSTAEQLPSIAANRGLEPKQLSSLVHGELDWIVMKALEKDRSRRYETASGFARDVERYLHDEAVQACPPSTVYRLRKFARRNRAALAAAAVMVVLLMAGITGTTIGMIRALHARTAEAQHRAKAEESLARAVTARAEAESARKEAEGARAEAQAVNGFLTDMFRSPQPDVAKGEQILVRDVLDRATKRIRDGGFKSSPGTEAGVRETLGTTYLALGIYPAAETHFRAALELRRRLFPAGHMDVANCLHNLGIVLAERGDLAGAESFLNEGLEMERKLHGEETASVATSLSALGRVLVGKGDLVGAESTLRRALEMRLKLLGEQHLDVAQSLDSLGVVLRQKGDLAGAEAMHRRSLAVLRKLLGEDHRLVAHGLNNLATVLHSKGEAAEAERLMRRALEIQR